MKRMARSLGPGIVAGIIVACSGPMTRTAAIIMQDAGDVLVDAGSRLSPDAARARIRDSGRGEGDSGHRGGLLDGAAQVLTDASRGMTKEAAAQSCASCSPSGAVRVTTADSDAAQIVSGYETNGSTNGNWAERVPGPFVVTSLIATILGNDAGISVAYADPGACGTSRTPLARVSVGTQWDSMQNGRYLVPKGKVLCVSGVVLSPSSVFVDYSWSGFKPYE